MGLGIRLSYLIKFSDLLSFKYKGLNLGNFVKLTVRDTGYEIDPKNIDRIFDTYFTTERPAERTGMGLAIVYGS